MSRLRKRLDALGSEGNALIEEEAAATVTALDSALADWNSPG